MAVSVDRELTLGVLFSGRVDAAFTQAVKAMRTSVAGAAKSTTAATTATKKAVAPTKKLADESSLLGKRISSVSGGFQRLTNAMRVTAAYGIAASAIFGVINALRGGVTSIFDYSQALKNLQAITGASDAEIGALGARIKQVAADTKYSAKEVSDATILLGQAGFSAAESLEAINAVAYLATGTLSNMADVSDLMTTAVRAFGMQASDAAMIADYFAVAVNKSKLTIDKLRIAFNYLGPIAKQADLTLRETAAGTMILANAGFRGSTIGTGFRQVLARLVAPSEKLQAIFAATGANLDKINPSTNDLKDVIGELTKVLGESVPKAERARRAFALFGLRGAASVSALAQAGVEGFTKMHDELGRVGAASEMAEKQIEGLSIMAKNLKDKLGILAVTIGEGGVAGAFRLLLGTLRPIVDILIYLAGTLTGKVFVAFTGFTTVILLGRMAIKYMLVQLSALSLGYSVLTVKTMIAAQWQNTLNVAWAAGLVAVKRLWAAMLANPFVAIASGVALLIAGLVTWRRHAKQTEASIKENIILVRSQIVALENYERRLEKTSGKEKEHSSIIRQLIKEYPELAGVVDIVTMKWTDEGKALDELIRKKKMLAIKGTAELLGGIKKEIEGHKRTIETLKERAVFFKNNASMHKYTTKDIMLQTKRLTQKQAEYDLMIKDTAETMRSFGITSKTVWFGIASLMAMGAKKGFFAYKEYAKDISQYIKNVEIEEEKNRQAQSKRQITLVSGMKGGWKEYYDTLDQLGKANLLLEADKTMTRIKGLRKAGKAAMLIPAQIEAVVDAYREEALRKFIATEDKKLAKRREFTEKIKLLLLSSQKDTLKIERRVEEERAKQKRDTLLREVDSLLLEAGAARKKKENVEIIYQNEMKKIGEKYNKLTIKKQEKFFNDLAILSKEYKKSDIELSKEKAKQDLKTATDVYKELYEKGLIKKEIYDEAFIKAHAAYNRRIAEIDKEAIDERKKIFNDLAILSKKYQEDDVELNKVKAKRDWEIAQDAWKERYDAGIVSKEEYNNALIILEEVYNRRIVEIDKEANDKKITEEERIRNIILGIESRATRTSLETTREKHERELAELDLRHKKEIDALKKLTDDKRVIKEAEAAQDRERNNLIVAQEEATYTQKLVSLRDFAGDFGDLFSAMYELSGKKRKEFLVAAKIASAVEATISAIVSAQKAYQAFAWAPPPVPQIAAGVAFAAGMARVALIRAQKYVKGGLIKGYSPSKTSDNIPIWANADEYIHPVDTVKYYGKVVMDAMRKRLIPKELFSGMFLPSIGTAPQKYAYATGGSVSGSPAGNINVNIINKTPIPVGAQVNESIDESGERTLNIVLDGAIRNKGGFKNQLRRALNA